MKKIIIDFNKINSYKDLNIFLEEKLSLSQKMTGGYWYNLSAFWDMYWYSKDEDFFEIHGYNSIDDPKFKEQVNCFIEILERLKGSVEVWWRTVPNPNFDYKIVS